MSLFREAQMRSWGFSSPTFLITVLIVICMETAIAAQLTTGSILGTVKDQSEAVLPGVNIKVTHVETGAVRTMATGSRGEYRIVSLPVGSYQVEAMLTGFQTSIRRGIELSVGRE